MIYELRTYWAPPIAGIIVGIIAFMWGPGGMHPADTAKTGMEAQQTRLDVTAKSEGASIRIHDEMQEYGHHQERVEIAVGERQGDA